MDDPGFRYISATFVHNRQEWKPDATTNGETYGPAGTSTGERVPGDGVRDTFSWTLRRSVPGDGPHLHG